MGIDMHAAIVAKPANGAKSAIATRHSAAKRVLKRSSSLYISDLAPPRTYRIYHSRKLSKNLLLQMSTYTPQKSYLAKKSTSTGGGTFRRYFPRSTCQGSWKITSKTVARGRGSYATSSSSTISRLVGSGHQDSEARRKRYGNLLQYKVARAGRKTVSTRAELAELVTSTPPEATTITAKSSELDVTKTASGNDE